MVDIKKIDITMSTIAVTSEEPPQSVSISQKELEGLLRRPIAIGQTPVGTIVSSQRDQIEAIVGANKINIRDLSGAPDFSESKIPTVLDFFIKKTGFKVNSYGVNFIITVPCMEPTQWIRDNVLSAVISEKTGKTVVGGSALLSVMSGQKIWNVKLESTDAETISVDFNASESTGQLPGQSRLREELQEQFDGLRQFLDDVGL